MSNISKLYKSSSIKIGKNYEAVACEYLLKNNLSFITKNYYSKYGEIDIIMLDKLLNILVFIEVRYRKSSLYGHPIETISNNKQEKLIKTAYDFMSKNTEYKNIQFRFDVVTILGKITNISWYKNIIS